MLFRCSLILTLALAWAIVMSCPLFAQIPTGVTSFTSGGTIHFRSRDLDLEIPEAFKVVDIKSTSDRKIVTAFSVLHAEGLSSRYRSEVWLFSDPPFGQKDSDAEHKKVGFQDRQVLVTMDTWDGESKTLCLFTVNCPQATAVYVDGWERGHTLLFDREGKEIPVDWPTSKVPGSRSRIDFIRPVLWLQEWQPEYRCRLVCIVSEHGDLEPLILLYDLQTAEIEMIPWGEALGSMGYQIIGGLWNIH
jgi:hypothetical protein